MIWHRSNTRKTRGDAIIAEINKIQCDLFFKASNWKLHHWNLIK